MIFRTAIITVMAAGAMSAPHPAGAQDKKAGRQDFITALNDTNIRDFLTEVREISTGQKPEMLDDDVVDYFNNHMTDKSEFKTHMSFDIPGYPRQESDIKLGKEEYVASIVEGRYLLEDYHTDIQLQDMKITGNGKSATFKSVTTERGRMPWYKDPDHKEDLEMIPIQGQSVCEETLVVSYNNFIQMAGADCTTTISFDAFNGKPLIPD